MISHDCNMVYIYGHGLFLIYLSALNNIIYTCCMQCMHPRVHGKVSCHSARHIKYI